jgi:hypothetical protein
VSFAAITLCVASQRVFIVNVIYFFTDSVRENLDTPSQTKSYQLLRLSNVCDVGGNAMY